MLGLAVPWGIGQTGPVGSRPETSTGLDMWLAFIAGEQVWIDEADEPSSLDRATAMVELAALGAVVAAIWLMFVAREPSPTGAARVAPFAGTLAVIALAYRPTRVVLRRRRAAKLWYSIVWRTVAGVVVLTALLANAPRWGSFIVAPFGVAAGAEAVLCARTIGYQVRPGHWFVGCIFSPLHAGVLAGLVAIAMWTSVDDLVTKALPVYAMLMLTVAVGCSSAWVINSARDQQEDEERLVTTQVASEEHRRAAHWLHDDVAAELRTVNLMLQSGPVEQHAIIRMLDDLDHRLRLRQLDELLASGSVRLAEVIQPFVRNAQRFGVTISRVPTFDDASLVVDARQGRLFARAASVLTINAIQAGATNLGFVIQHDEDVITLSVSDDAGGFDLSNIPAGRALWELDHEIGSGSIRTTRNGPGTTVTVRIPRREAADYGELAGR